ncbi:MAG: hypothetical protein QGF46_03125, partial [Planctomycetota bacterium]|nr:hypothetical protein [Planctomycetota bacterium]
MRVLGAIAMLVAGFLYFSSYNPAYQTAPNLPQQVAKKYEQSRVPITEEAVIRNLQQNSAIDFLRQLKNLNPDSDKEILKSQCRAYLVGYSEFPQQELSWGGFIHELYSACMGNEIASEIVASAIKGQKMIGVNELILVQDIRPTEIDSASENQCYWQAQLFINSIEIIFPAAVSDSREDIVLPYLDDPSNKVSLIAFMALNPKFDGKSYSSISEFIATLD